MTVHDDLATLRRAISYSRPDYSAPEALSRVEAEIARLEEDKNGWQEEAQEYERRLRLYDAPAPWEAQVVLANALCEKAERRAEAAEAALADMRRALLVARDWIVDDDPGEADTGGFHAALVNHIDRALAAAGPASEEGTA